MISSVTIKNYKSIVDLSLPLGRFNVLIGENGCGKTNILEALTLGAAAQSGSLDKQFLETKGIRMTAPRFMMPAFEDINPSQIELSLDTSEHRQWKHILQFDSLHKPASWIDLVKQNTDRLLSKIRQSISENGELTTSDLADILTNINLPDTAEFNIHFTEHPLQLLLQKSQEWSRFQTFSLDEYELRSYSQPGETSLSIHGKGLFSYLKELSHRPEGFQILSEIREGLKLLDWFDDITIPDNQLMNENDVFLRDRYISDTLSAFDQRSTNEGFLYLLFYLTLVISDDTPSFFAIDNLDSSFNPKLCREVTRQLIILSKKHDKQIIATTHNPAILDGLNLDDDEQKLMVVQRSIDGYTKVRTIKNEETSRSSMKLSQLWLGGYIGGLPVNF